MTIHQSLSQRALPLALPTRHTLSKISSVCPRSIQSRLSSTSTSSDSPPRNPRWLSDQKSRLGKCITFGLQPNQLQQAGRLARVLAEEWRGLVAGAEGFPVPPAADTTNRETAWEEKITWGSQDSMIGLGADLLQGHVNNVNYVRYAESSRVWYFRRLAKHVPMQYRREWDALISPKGIGLILKSISVDYLFPLQYPDRISVYHRFVLPEVLQPSLILKVSILSHKHQRAAARVSEDVVVYDYRQGRKTDPPHWMAEVLRKAEAQERESSTHWLAKRAEIEEALHKLEAESVFSGRNEDFGQGAKQSIVK